MGRGVEHDQVGSRARRQVADVAAAERQRAARGGGPDRLRCGHVHVADGDRDAERHARGVGRARVAVARQGDRRARVEQAAGVRVGLAGAEFGPRQQGGDGARRVRRRRRRRERGHVGVGEERAVVRRRRAELDREQDALARAELAGVDPGDQPARPAGRQHRPGLIDAERAALAEHVHPAGVRRAGVEHRAAHQVHVRSGVPLELGRDHVRAEVGHLPGGLGRQRHRPRLVLDRQPVAGLALEGGGALREHLRREPAQPGPQVGVGGGPRRRHRRPDAAGRVAAAGHPRGELGRPLPGEHQVRVRVDEPGQHRPAGRVDRFIGGRRAGRRPVQAIRSPSMTSAASLITANRPGPRRAEPAARAGLGRVGRARRVGHQLADPVDQHRPSH